MPSKATGKVTAALNGARLTPRRIASLIRGSILMSQVLQDTTVIWVQGTLRRYHLILQRTTLADTWPMYNSERK